MTNQTYDPITFTAEETEQFRLEQLEEAANDRDLAPADLAKDFAPGTYGCHEALQMASVFMDSVDRHLCGHPAVLANPQWFQMASDAQTALFNLYQAIGAYHLGVLPESDGGFRKPKSSDEGKRPDELNASHDD